MQSISRYRRLGQWHDGVVLAMIGCLALGYCLISRPLSPPDEEAHVLYPREIIVERHLPVLTRTSDAWENHQPPLYYILSLPSTWLGQRASFEQQILINRLTSVALFWLACWLTWLAARRLWPSDPWLRLVVISMMALPMALYVGGSFSNDALVLCVAAALLWLIVAKPATMSWRWAALLGVVIGAGALTKLTLYPMLGVVGVWLLWRQSWKVWLVTGSAVIATAGWWWIQNLIRVGDMFGLKYANDFFRGQHLELDSWSAFGRLASKTAVSFFGVFGKQDLWLPTWWYVAMGLGICVAVLLVHRQPRGKYFGLSWLIIASSVTGFVWLNSVIYQPQGRYLIMLVPVVGYWLAIAVAKVHRYTRVISLAWCALLVGANVQALMLLHQQPLPTVFQYPRTIDLATAINRNRPEELPLVDGGYRVLAPQKFVVGGNLVDTKHHPSFHVVLADSQPTKLRLEWRVAGQRWFTVSRQLETSVTGQADIPIPETTVTALINLRISWLDPNRTIIIRSMTMSAE